jgi:hypothetical protein
MQLQRFPLNDLGYYLLLIDIALTPENNEQLELEFEENTDSNVNLKDLINS